MDALNTSVESVVYTNTLVETINIAGTRLIQDPFSTSDICYQCFCPWNAYVEYTGATSDQKALGIQFYNSCIPCPCCSWNAAIATVHH